MWNTVKIFVIKTIKSAIGRAQSWNNFINHFINDSLDQDRTYFHIKFWKYSKQTKSDSFSLLICASAVSGVHSASKFLKITWVLIHTGNIQCGIIADDTDTCLWVRSVAVINSGVCLVTVVVLDSQEKQLATGQLHSMRRRILIGCNYWLAVTIPRD